MLRFNRKENNRFMGDWINTNEGKQKLWQEKVVIKQMRERERKKEQKGGVTKRET